MIVTEKMIQAGRRALENHEYNTPEIKVAAIYEEMLITRPPHVNTSAPTESPSPLKRLRNEDSPCHHPLYGPLMAAIEQAMFGKGERHGGHRVPFMEQQWRALVKEHGLGFLTGQAAKKLNEAASRGKYDATYKQELLGAIVYIGMALLFKAETEGRDDGGGGRVGQEVSATPIETQGGGVLGGVKRAMRQFSHNSDEGIGQIGSPEHGRVPG